MTAVFVSYTAKDKRLVYALDVLLKSIVPDVVVRYSDPEQGGGPPPGTPWLAWIVDQVKGCDVTLVVLTSSSVQKPWPMWEAGAVAGASYGEGRERPIVPIRFGVPNDRMPDPLRNLQSVDGRSEAELKALVRGAIWKEAKASPMFERYWTNPDTKAAVAAYLSSVNDAMHLLPIAPTEATISEWARRLDDLRANDLWSQAPQLERWITLAFGSEEAGREVPLDVRIHRRLAEMYAHVNAHASAIRQLRLARELAPRDLFVLRALAEATLKSGDLDAASAVMEEIQGLDPKAFEENPECAGLRGRWNKMRKEWRSARDDYQRVLAVKPSYYMADNVGQLSARIRELDRAREAYKQARDIIAALNERSTWARATLANAAIVIGDESELPHLKAVADGHPSPRELDSIRDGLEHLRLGLDVPTERVGAWERALAGRA